MEYKIYTPKGMEFYGERIKELLKADDYDKDSPALFMGLYHEEDYQTFNNHTKDKAIYWNGSDVSRLLDNPAWQTILKMWPRTRHACHNGLLQKELESVGVKTEIRPLLFADPKKYKTGFKKNGNLQFYLTMRPDREEEYGWSTIERMADKFSNIIFHIYGINRESKFKNIVTHGQVEEKEMDTDIVHYHGAIRLNKHDGLSQTLIKSILLGQYPISVIECEEVIHVENDDELESCILMIDSKTKANTKARKYYLDRLNKFDWLDQEKGLISLVMIVKDEEMGIKRAVTSARNIVDEVIISVDKSSTDKTMEIAGNIADRVIEHKWCDNFSKIRNIAQKKANSPWILILDGHEYIENFPVDIRDQLREMTDRDHAVNTVKMENNTTISFPRIIRKEVEWKNKAHNYPECKKGKSMLDLIIKHDRDGGQTIKSRSARNDQRDKMLIKILGENIKKNPKDTRSIYYLAQQHRDASRIDEAIEWYKKYLEVGKWNEERYCACYYTAKLLLVKKENEEAVKMINKAEKEMPGRKETRFMKGRILYVQEKYHQALKELLSALFIPFKRYAFNPEISADKEIYDLLAMVYYHLRLYKFAIASTEYTLKLTNNPDDIKRLKNNIDSFNKQQ